VFSGLLFWEVQIHGVEELQTKTSKQTPKIIRLTRRELLKFMDLVIGIYL
jgi:hypothetical protein